MGLASVGKGSGLPPALVVALTAMAGAFVVWFDPLGDPIEEVEYVTYVTKICARRHPVSQVYEWYPQEVYESTGRPGFGLWPPFDRTHGPVLNPSVLPQHASVDTVWRRYARPPAINGALIPSAAGDSIYAHLWLNEVTLIAPSVVVPEPGFQSEPCPPR